MPPSAGVSGDFVSDGLRPKALRIPSAPIGASCAITYSWQLEALYSLGESKEPFTQIRRTADLDDADRQRSEGVSPRMGRIKGGSGPAEGDRR